MDKSQTISVVIPAYNESENIKLLIEELIDVLGKIGSEYDIIIVDDNSSDDTSDKVLEMKKNYNNIRLIRFKQNHGQTAALDAGFRNATGNIIITLDADLQNDPSDIPMMLSSLKEADAVCGWRFNRQDSMVKRISSVVANGVRNWATQENIHDTACALKVFKKECIDKIKLYKGFHRFLPTLAKIEGYKVLEVKVNHRPRKYGDSKYNIWNRLFKSLYDLIVVRWMMKQQLNYQEDMLEL